MSFVKFLKMDLINQLFQSYGQICLFLVGIGTGGFSNYTKKIREIYGGNNFKFCLMGLSASEGNFSVPYELENPNSLLLPDSIFYEFRPVHDDNMDNILTLDQLKEGEDYELIITNLSGFYRYRMQDVIRVTGKYNNMPTIQFLYRLNQTVNLAGEKKLQKWF
ncbi:GH3 auxin-responsive promoter family protein [Methanobrevibacter arboriphilus]|uniref:GH3 auxin-responsive promoter family protein n=1 Tax=Methanobrevibacter arboriphilus TaxID=39441 RepID=UPI000A7DD9E7|nr:GH3 auxin-responsive promoter family protein [Methanobrevibacter arboriphilus]